MSRDLISPVIERLNATRRATSEAGDEVDISAFAIRPGAGEVLERAAGALRTDTLIEIGCASALSTLYMIRGHRPRVAHLADPKQTTHWKGIGRASLRAAGLESIVQLHETPADQLLPKLLAGGMTTRFAFIDGWHMLDYIMVEAHYLDQMLEVGGAIAIHDLWMPALQHFASYWTANKPYEPVTATETGLSRSPALADTRDAAHENGSDYYVREIAPYVEHSVLLLRKTGHDQRAWDFYRDYLA